MRMWMVRLACAVLLGLALLAPLGAGTIGAEPAVPGPASLAEAEAAYFPETGHAVSGVFWDFWRRRGALDVFGYPLTAAYEDEGVLVQWFQRARFERWPDRAGVVLALLGQEMGIYEPPLPPPADQAALQAAGLRYFPETGHLVGGAILRFFESYGGVEIFGYPLTEEIAVGPEDRGGVVQWFQRGRLEWRPDTGVQAGLTGQELLHRHGLADSPAARRTERPAGTPDWYPALVAFLEEQERLAREAREQLARETGPLLLVSGPVYGEKWIDIDLTRQRITAYVGSTPVFTDLVSTGKVGKGLTPTGTFRILRRVANATMDARTIGIPPGHPLYYRLENVLYTQYFTTAGHAIHYAWWHNNFGQPMSFGCVNLRLSTARWFWDWATIGTRIVIHY